MCPSSATVTSTFYSFIAGTKAKASEVISNFDQFRGFLIPINTDTSTGSDNTHDLGSTDHRWRRIYLGEPPYVNGSQLGKLPIECVSDDVTSPAWTDPQDQLSRIGFQTDTNTSVIFSFVVPSEYKPGNRLALTLKAFAQTTGAAVFHSVARMYRMGTDYGSSVPSAVLTGTATYTCSVAGLFFEDSSLKLTDSGGLMNGITCTVGNVISVKLERKTSDGSDVNSGTVYLNQIVVDLNN